MTSPIDPIHLSRDAHRFLAFIYFAFAEADASWTNEETFTLYEFLERQAGDLTREQSVALAQEAFGWISGVEGNEARLRVIEEKAPELLGHLDGAARQALLDSFRVLARADGEVSADERSMQARISRAVLGAPSRPALKLDDESLRMAAFVYFTCAEADQSWTNEETFALYSFLEKQSGDGSPERSVALAQEAYQRILGVEGNAARLAVIREEGPRALAALSEAQRRALLDNLLELAKSDGKVTRAERSVYDTVRQILR